MIVDRCFAYHFLIRWSLDLMIIFPLLFSDLGFFVFKSLFFEMISLVFVVVTLILASLSLLLLFYFFLMIFSYFSFFCYLLVLILSLLNLLSSISFSLDYFSVTRKVFYSEENMFLRPSSILTLILRLSTQREHTIFSPRKSI